MKVNLEIKDNIILGYSTFPLNEETAVELDESTLSLIDKHVGCINTNYQVIDELVSKEEKQAKIAVLKAKLTATDYKAIKYAEGAISEYDYIPVKQERQAWRNEINQLEGELHGNTSSNQ